MTVRAHARVDTPLRVRSQLGAILALVRWPNALIASAGVVVGAWWAAPGFDWSRRMTLGVMAAWLVTAAVNALNDAADVEIDRIAHPERPIPRGELSRAAATRVGIGAMVFGVGVARAMPTEAATIVYGAMCAAMAYAYSLNRAILLGNVVVAVVASLPFLLGAALVDEAGAALALFGVAVPLHFAREVMKDVVDAPGDRGRRDTMPLRWGARAAQAVALVAVAGYAALASFLFAPAGARLLSLAPSVAVAAWGAARASRRSPLLLKISMLLAMAALPLLR